MGETGKPASAYSIAGARTSVSFSLPNRPTNSAQAAGAPGTVTGSQPSTGICRNPCCSSSSGVKAVGAGPLELRPYNFSFSQTNANASPPIPLEVGSTTVRHAAVATAASTALPPWRKICSPAWAAKFCEVATMPFFAKTTLRREG